MSAPTQARAVVAELVGPALLLAAVVGSRIMGDRLAGDNITSACWFTASTSFANPAVTIARAFTNTFAGIQAADVPGFLAGQALGAFAATVLFKWFSPVLPQVAEDVVVPSE